MSGLYSISCNVPARSSLAISTSSGPPSLPLAMALLAPPAALGPGLGVLAGANEHSVGSAPATCEDTSGEG